MRTHITAIYLLLAFLVSINVSTFAKTQHLTESPNQSATIAKVTEAKGHVYKRGFIDWTRETWGDPVPASVGDELQNGMQIGTGDKSWAQIAWRFVTTRAWANAVFAVAPNERLIYLLNGEMLVNLDKNRKDKNSYYVWTKLLQARIHGTTVLLQSYKDKATGEEVGRLTILEGNVTVTNRVDGSRCNLSSPGVVFEVRAREVGKVEEKQQKAQAPSQASTVAQNQERTIEPSLAERSRSTSDGFAESESSDFVEIAAMPKIPFVQTDNVKTNNRFISVTTYGSVADPSALLKHPLVNDFASRLPDLALVQSSLIKIRDTFGAAETASGRSSTVDTEKASLSKMLAPVTVVEVPVPPYLIGPDAESIAFAPGILERHPPTGVIGNVIGKKYDTKRKRSQEDTALEPGSHPSNVARSLTVEPRVFVNYSSPSAVPSSNVSGISFWGLPPIQSTSSPPPLGAGSQGSGLPVGSGPGGGPMGGPGP